MNPYEVLGLKRGATLEEIRQRYKHLAKLNHPDRLHNVGAEEKQQKEEYFKRVTVAYHLAVEAAAADSDSESAGASAGADAWGWSDMRDVLMNTFVDVATKYMQRKEHHLHVPVELQDVFLKRQKKLQIFLKGIDTPVMLTVACHKKQVITDVLLEDGEIHKVHLHLRVKDHPLYAMTNEGDVVANINLSWREYIQGKTIEAPFLDGSAVCMIVPPFPVIDEPLLHPSGRFQMRFRIVCPCQEWWAHIDAADQEKIINLLENQDNSR